MSDDLDRALIHALHIDGRVPFSRIAAVLDVSPQTVARCYRRLRAEASLRVVGLPDPHHAGLAQWLVRITTTPRVAQDVAQALIRRTDTSRVNLTSGGTEIVTIMHTPTISTNHTLLLRDIPRTDGITAVSAQRLLHTYLGGSTVWPGQASALTDQQRRELTPPADADTTDAPSLRHALADTDNDLLAALARDGRASHADLAAATGWSPVTVARRLTNLQQSGAIFFDVEIDPTLFGATTRTLLWMAVTPAQLDHVANALSHHEELAFVAATTGPTNVVALALCHDSDALYHYLTHRLGALDAIVTLESSPVLRNLKAGGPISNHLTAARPAPNRRLGS